MTDNEVMTLEKALFILRHGSAEGEHKYFEAIEIIENEINRLQAANKRLTIRLRKAEHQLDDLCKMYNIIKAEAIKEIAERLKEVSSHIVDMNLDVIEFVEVKQIDNLVKEMVGEGDDEQRSI